MTDEISLDFSSAFSLIIAVLLLTRNGLALPIQNSAKLHDACIAELDKLLGSLFAASAATAVYHNELIFVWQLGDFCRANGFVWHVDSSRNMPCGELIGSAHVEDDISRLLRHYINRFVHSDLSVGVGLTIAYHGASAKHQRG